jgi:ribosomal-protein-serine acetyltransferase
VECVAGLDHPTAPQIRRLAGIRLAVLPGEALAVAVDPAVISAAASALQVEASRWARLRVGEALSYRWPPEPRRPSGGGGHAARLVRPDMPDMRDIGEQAGGAGCRDIRLCQWPASRQHGAMDARPDEIIETGEVILRRYREGDEAALVETVTTSLDHLGPWMPWAVGYSRAAAAEFLAGAAWDWAAGAAYNYAIITGGVLAGGISLMARIGPGGLEIGYWVHQGYTRRGLATTAAAALVQQAFALPGIDRVEIVHDELNVASGGVPRKLGFTEAGRRPIDPPPAAGTGMGVVWRLVR